MRVLAQRHMIDGRWCDVKIPNSKEGQVCLCDIILTYRYIRKNLKYKKFYQQNWVSVFVPVPVRNL
jgi:hypothetical protein